MIPKEKNHIKKKILFTIIIIVSYILASKVGFFLAFLNSQVSPVWPPEGVALTSLLLLRYQAIPGIFLGAFLANYLNNPHLETAFIIGFGNSIGAVINFYLLHKLTGSVHIFDKSWNLFKFLFFCTIPGSAFSAGIGVSSLLFYGFVPSDAYWNILLTWFSGEMLGFILVAPFLFTWIKYQTLEFNISKSLEMLLILITMLISSLFAFSEKLPISYIPFPFIVWMSFRFGRHGATLSIIILTSIAVFRTVNGIGPFAIYINQKMSLNNSLILLDTYLGSITIMTYFLITILREREHAQDNFFRNLKRIEKIKDKANLELENKVIERTKTIQNQNKELEKQIEMAGKIQSSLLPSFIPDLKQLKIAVKFQPMMKLGGDFFDIKQDKNLVGIFLCDVSGHGVPAAFLAALVKMSLTFWNENIGLLIKSFEHIHASIQDKLGKNFISASLCSIDLQTYKLTTARAGHYPVLIVKHSGESFYLYSKGRVIMQGIAPNSDEVSIYLEDKDRIFIYTDGIIEAKSHNRNEMYSEERMLELILLLKEKPIQEVVDTIFQSVIDYSGGIEKIEDDATFIAIEVQKREN